MELTEIKTEEDQIKYVKQFYLNIVNIDNPSERVQLEAVKNDGYSIKSIKHPCEAAQLIAVKQGPYFFQLIDDPCEAAINFIIENYDYETAKDVLRTLNINCFKLSEETKCALRLLEINLLGL